MKTFWDVRYSSEAFVYGKEANDFFASELDKLIPGKILLPGEGEGRNAVFAASRAWTVDAFDQSTAGSEKARLLAEEKGVRVNYMVSGVEDYSYPQDYYDAVGLIYFHVPPSLRKMLHEKVIQALKPGGIVILEAFHTSQLGNNTGGPQSLELLFDKEIILHDFKDLEILNIDELGVALNEGPFHQGQASIIRYIGKKPT